MSKPIPESMRRVLKKAGRKGGKRGSVEAKRRAGKLGWQATVNKYEELEKQQQPPAQPAEPTADQKPEPEPVPAQETTPTPAAQPEPQPSTPFSPFSKRST